MSLVMPPAERPELGTFAIGFDQRDRARLHELWDQVLTSQRWSQGPLVEAFQGKGLKVGRRFPALPTYLRISIGTDAEMQAFLAALRELVPARPA